ncbi:hypothetical protein BX666DRAFT_1948420 [Dichotomocladium elegans]|nr:hypothetical protein BX666DRAFT_1948420 [Dichotomocladium elegans]
MPVLPPSSSPTYVQSPSMLHCNGSDNDTNSTSRFYHALNHQRSTAATSSPPQLARSKSTGSFSNIMSSPRRLSSGSACEVCRRRKTKCDGGHPCGFCSANRIECVHRATRRKKSSLAMSISHSDIVYRHGAAINNNNAIGTPRPSSLKNHGLGQYHAKPTTNNLSKQTSCPSLIVSAAFAAATTTAAAAAATGDVASVTTTAALPTQWSMSPTPPPHHGSIIRGGAGGGGGSDGGGVGGTSCGREDTYRSSKKEMPSMMDQLSCRTFSGFVDYRANYPIYPLSSPSPSERNNQHLLSTSANFSSSSAPLPLKADHDRQNQQYIQQTEFPAADHP